MFVLFFFVCDISQLKELKKYKEEENDRQKSNEGRGKGIKQLYYVSSEMEAIKITM